MGGKVGNGDDGNHIEMDCMFLFQLRQLALMRKVGELRICSKQHTHLSWHAWICGTGFRFPIGAPFNGLKLTTPQLGWIDKLRNALVGNSDRSGPRLRGGDAHHSCP